MYVKNINGLRILYPSIKGNVIRSRITNIIYNECVPLSKNDLEEYYCEEKPLDKNINVLDKLEISRAKKLNDLDVRYSILKSKIEQAKSLEDLLEIEIFK